MILLGSRLAAELFYISAILLDAGVKTFDLILKVTHFKGKLAADKADTVNL